MTDLKFLVHLTANQSCDLCYKFIDWFCVHEQLALNALRAMIKFGYGFNYLYHKLQSKNYVFYTIYCFKKILSLFARTKKHVNMEMKIDCFAIIFIIIIVSIIILIIFIIIISWFGVKVKSIETYSKIK